MKRGAATVLLAAVVTLAACGGDATVAPPEVPRLYDLDHDPTAGVTFDPEATVPADQLRLVVQDLFEWHSISLTGALRATATLGPAQDGWVEQLAVNSDEVARAVALVYGRDGGRAFDQQWAQHAQFLVDYAAARQRGDADAMAEARSKLAAYERDAGLFLGRATGGRLPAATAEAALREHVERMLAVIDALVGGDDAAAARLVLEDHGYLTGVADALAGAFAAQQPERFPGALDTAYAEFCVVARRAVGAYTVTAVGEIDAPSPSARLVALGDDVTEAVTGVRFDATSQLLAGWRATFVASPDAYPAAVKRSLADTAALIDTVAPGAG